MNLEKTIVKVRSELPAQEEILVYIKFFVKDATVLEKGVLLLACVDDCRKLSEVLSVQHLLAKLREVLNSLLTHPYLKIQEVLHSVVDVVFEDQVQVILESRRIARVGVKFRYLIGS